MSLHRRRRWVLSSNALHQVMAGMLSLAPCASYHSIALVCKHWREELCDSIRSHELLRLMAACLLYCNERLVSDLRNHVVLRFASEGSVTPQLQAVSPWAKILDIVQRACRVTGRFVARGHYCGSFSRFHPVHACIHTYIHSRMNLQMSL